MNQKCIGMVVLACAALSGLRVYAFDTEALDDPARYVAALRERRLIDDTLRPQIQEVVNVLVAAARQWPRGQVNGQYDARAVNVYLLDLGSSGAKPALDDLTGTLRALPEQRMILADARYLAQLKAAADVYMDSLRRGDRSVRASDVLVVAMTEGPDRAVRSRLGQSADWRQGTNELFDGAVAFLVAHEMGHVVAGLAPMARERLPRGLKGRDRDRFWACASLVGENVNNRRREETKADAYAAGLLERIAHPSQSSRRLRYEHGTLFLKNAELGKVTAALAALSPNAESLTRVAGLRVNPTTIQAMGEALGRDEGMIQKAFPHSHPAQVERLLDVVSRLARNPMSAYYGEADYAGERKIWDMLIQIMCRPIEGRHAVQ